ncbi:MAG: hypothetical protein LUF33_03360 [Clostridiales bacterium]|nr:hypothetical protein [Clostridiales bacterium]
MKKKFYAIVMTALTVMSAAAFSACGDESDSTADEAATTGVVTMAEETEVTTTIAPTTEEVTEQETTKKAESSETTVPSTASSATSAQSSQTSKAQSTQSSKTSSAAASSAAALSNAGSSAAAGTFSSSDVVFIYNGVSINLGDNMSNVISKIGNASSVTSAPSCHGVGEDKTYTYSGFEIYTCPNGSEDMIIEIMVTSSSISTQKGIKVGPSKSDVIAQYGKNYTTSGYYYVYASGTKSIQFFMSGDTVEQVDYYYDV